MKPDVFIFTLSSNIPTCFIQHSKVQNFKSPFIQQFKMANTATLVVLLPELMDSDDKKSHRGKTREWMKRRNERGYFNNNTKDLRIEDQISDLISSSRKTCCDQSNWMQWEIWTNSTLFDNRSFQSLNFQYRILLNTVSYIAKGCCKAIIERFP